MFYWTRRSIGNKFEQVKQAIRRTRKRAQRRLTRSTSKLSRKSNRILSSTQRTVRATKRLLISPLFGISKSRLPEPPCPHLLLSNQAPTEQEVELILEAIERAHEEELRLNTVLLQKRESKHKNFGSGNGRRGELVIKHKIDRTKNFIHQYQGVVSLLRRLPVELLQDIFLEVTRSVEHSSHIRFDRPPAWALSQTCRSWRIITLNLPFLWSCLPVIRIQQSRTTTKLQVQFFSELLRRSIGAALDICIDATEIEHDLHYHDAIIDLLCQQAERWETVTMALHQWALANFRPIKGRLNALKSLSLTAPATSQWIADLDGIDLFQDAPLLASVHIDTPFSRQISMPFSQIKYYKEQFSFDNRQVERAMASPVLETLTMIALVDVFVFPKMTLPCLVQLHVEFRYGPHLEDEHNNCFGNLTLPAIQDIRLLVRNDNVAPSLIRMLKNSSPCTALQTLAMRFRYIGHGQLTELLWLTPSLVHLSTTLPSTSDADIHNIAEAILSEPPYQSLAPLLETCEFFNGDDITSNMSVALSKLAMFRCEPMIEIPPTYCDPLLPDTINRIKNLTISFSGPASPNLQSQHNRFEAWPVTIPSFDLSLLRDELVEKLPDLLYYGYHEQGGIRYRSENDKVRKILARIDAFKVEDVRDIFSSGVLYALKAIATCQCPGKKNGPLAKKILDKWKPMTENPKTLEKRRWAMRNNCSLVYIPRDSELRTKSPEDIVLGVVDHHPDVFCF